ncbi:MAG: P-loop NTPase [Acidobacteriota bacterium]
MPRRIIPVASGKGGVGKTTFAVNFALGLARSGSTILVDLDTGTSSVRSVLNVPIERDLYHFKRKEVPLAQCITRLDDAHDPRREFKNFGFIAAPKHFIEDLANPTAEFRKRLASEISHLPADYVVLDLRAGLDLNVIEFLPFTNSGVLVFTPHHPAATTSVADIVKAILFRSLRILFAPDSAFYQRDGMARYETMVRELLDRVEDVYDPELPNLDTFVDQLQEAFGRHPILDVIVEMLESFRVHYVLNMFNGVDQGFQSAIKPMVETLASTVSSRLNLTQLGWIVQDEQVHESTRSGYPILLDRPVRTTPVKAPPTANKIKAELEALESSFLGLKRSTRVRKAPAAPPPPAPQASDVMNGQLDSLRAMFNDRRKDTPKDNFLYIVYRALNLMSSHMATTEFGETSIATPEQLQRWFLKRQLEGQF